ncbi:MAG: beta-ketoacyl-[acyl-carrier-protein] synthase family protein [Candidatus Omnitrophica bacterium]|nr:beta-ketoacyl-[acyl-carrier-protein] synthase family protein [Candidatus Omnitrophota bacterium]
MERRVVITGLGIIASNGIGKEKFWEAITLGESGIKKITMFDASDYPTQIAGEVSNFRPLDFMSNKEARFIDRATQFIVACAEMAIKDAGLDLSRENTERIGVDVGTAIGGQGWAFEQYEIFKKRGILGANPLSIVATYPNALSTQLSIRFNIKGGSETFSIGCSSGLSAIGHAFEKIRRGMLDIVLTGGSDAPLFLPIFAAFCLAGNMSTRNINPKKASRPFDKMRDGLVLSEGAGIIVLEEFNHAVKRKAHIYAEVKGWGMTSDGYHIVEPDPDGEQAARSIKIALKNSGISPLQIDYICAFGISTKKSDVVETNVIKKVFKKYAYRIPLSSIKSMIGQPLAASGVLQLITSVLAIESNIIPPTINYEYVDPECDLDYVPNESRRKKVRNVLTYTFGFGGKNVSLIVAKIEKI